MRFLLSSFHLSPYIPLAHSLPLTARYVCTCLRAHPIAATAGARRGGKAPRITLSAPFYCSCTNLPASHALLWAVASGRNRFARKKKGEGLVLCFADDICIGHLQSSVLYYK